MLFRFGSGCTKNNGKCIKQKIMEISNVEYSIISEGVLWTISRCGADGTFFFIEKPEAELQYKSGKK